ncbi:MAG TPA: biotin--[acetyl-CoA-carboxylase] ligase [Gemmatimonadales bacterium]|nr:biotin--[acetyl-CoA-carboxylase] ligase [Gemmatimonadales bacterium]
MASLTLDGIPGAALAKRWGVPQAGVFDSLGSTLDSIHELGGRGAPSGTVVIAEVQTAGRGRDGRTWRSPVGGLWLGVLLKPQSSDLGVYSIRVGLVVADAIDELLGRPVARVKWPNDVVLTDRKVAGILCEGRWQGDALQWLAIGIGCNVANEIPADVADRATRLIDHRPGVTRLDLCDRLVPALPRLGAAGLRLTDAEVGAFASRDWLAGRDIRLPLAGRARGLRADGALMVETARGAEAVREGHVELA